MVRCFLFSLINWHFFTFLRFSRKKDISLFKKSAFLSKADILKLLLPPYRVVFSCSFKSSISYRISLMDWYCSLNSYIIDLWSVIHHTSSFSISSVPINLDISSSSDLRSFDCNYVKPLVVVYLKHIPKCEALFLRLFGGVKGLPHLKLLCVDVRCCPHI